MSSIFNMEDKYIEIKGARVNNLKNISLRIPRNKFISITGLSGSGKSSLAFDTLYAEGQRRYVESLSSYARQFLGRMSKHQRPSPRHCHRAESNRAQPPIYRRNLHGDLRIPAFSVRTHRSNILSHIRTRSEKTLHR